jgi:DMSO/TMAO reductase YedYZ heme-binding membrane subunit
MDYVPLLTSVAVVAAFFLLFSKSIEKHTTAYYIIFGIPFVLSLIQFIFALTKITTFSFYKTPIVGNIMGVNGHMAVFGFPLLIVIMYIGALNTKNTAIRKLMSIRKEMSIISGFPVLTHALVRVTYTFPHALKYFTNHSGYIAENDWIKNDLAAVLSNFGYVLGVVMTALFLVLWVTSFDSVRRKMGGRSWKKVQRWSYALYAMLFIHSITLHLGWLINSGFKDSAYATKEIIGITSTVLIFLSYLILRLRKATDFFIHHNSTLTD